MPLPRATLPPLGTAACSEIVSSFAVADGRPWGVYQAGGGDGIVAALAEQVEEQVFCEEYSLDPVALADEFGPYNDRSVWSLMVNHDTMLPVGSQRSIVGPSREQKAAKDLGTFFNLSWEEATGLVGMDPDAQFVDACTISVLHEWRKADRRWPMFVTVASLLHVLADVGADASIQIINPRVLRWFKQFGCPFVTTGQMVDIEGADFMAAFFPAGDNFDWLSSADSDFVDLVRRRSEDGRGGTRLEPIDLDGPVALRHHNLVVERDRAAAEAVDSSSAS